MTNTALDAAHVEKLFSPKQGAYHFARWGRPIAPVIFGVDDTTLTHLKSAVATTIGLTGGQIVETDPELGANFMWFFCKDWDEILTVPDLDRLVPNLAELVKHLNDTNSLRHRSFAFDAEGGIKLCILMMRVTEQVASVSPHILATGETFQCLALFTPNAFHDHSPIAVIQENNMCLAKPNYAALIRAAYDPVMPVSSTDASHALRLAARAGKMLVDMEK